MSNLNSLFDTIRGWPSGSALENSFEPDSSVASIAEGMLVQAASRQLVAASVLKIVDDTLVTAPTLTTTDAGKAYGVAGIGGAWSVFDIGDIVEWDGTDWNLIVAAVEAEFATGTRAVVVSASAAGAFAGHEEKIATYTKHTVELTCTVGGYTPCIPTDIGKPVVATGSGDTGTLVSYDNPSYTWIVDPDTPADVFQDADALAVTGGDGIGIVDTGGVAPLGGAWALVVPVNKNRILIDGTNGVYDGKYYEYIGAHPAGSWNISLHQTVAPAMASLLTSGIAASAIRDHAWLVIQGNDQSDAKFVNKITCIKCHTGFIAKVQSDIANTLAPGDFVHAVAGVLTKTVAGGGMKWPAALVIGSNNTAGATGWVIIAS